MRKIAFIIGLALTIPAQALNEINKPLGNQGIHYCFGSVNVNELSEQEKITAHLFFVRQLLVSRKTTDLGKNKVMKRKHIIRLLDQYILNQSFPKNQKYLTRRPCFIDDKENICAVGYLVEETAGRESAKKINASFQYAYIDGMEDQIDEWASENGLTIKECAMIQPTYQNFIRLNGQANGIGPAYGIIARKGSLQHQFGLEGYWQNTKKRNLGLLLSAGFSPMGSGEYLLRYQMGVYMRYLPKNFKLYTKLGLEQFDINKSIGVNLLPEFGLTWRKYYKNWHLELGSGYAYSIPTNDQSFALSRHQWVNQVNLRYYFY